jgi:hypothetical protein
MAYCNNINAISIRTLSSSSTPSMFRFISTSSQFIDILTKGLPSSEFRFSLNICSG